MSVRYEANINRAALDYFAVAMEEQRARLKIRPGKSLDELLAEQERMERAISTARMLSEKMQQIIAKLGKEPTP